MYPIDDPQRRPIPVPKLTPEQIQVRINAANTRATARRALIEEKKTRLKTAVTAGFRFVIAGNTTICYKIEGRNTISLSTAIRNPVDRFDALDGKLTALYRYQAGHRIFMARNQSTLIFAEKGFRRASLKEHLYNSFGGNL